MPDAVPPFLLFLLGAILVPLLRGRARQVVALAVPLLSFFNAFRIRPGVHWRFDLLDFELILGRADAWSQLFLQLFLLVSLVGILYVIRQNRPLELSGGLLYAGSAVGVVMAGDLLSLFLFWEMLTLGAVLCLLARGTPASGAAAKRYLLVHLFGGVVLLAGLVLHWAGGGGTAVGKIVLEGPGPWLIFLGFGINCAWPVLGAWLTDTYPEASPGGLLFMAAFTTKTALYVLARTFPGESLLVWIGVAMAVLPLVYAVLENDLRRVLAYALVNQVGIMVVGVGIGTPLALNGAAAQAYGHVLYKTLLFMALGSVLHRTGRTRASELGGLVRSMPLTTLFACLGAAGMVLSGLGGKAMVKSAVAGTGEPLVWLALVFASAGAFLTAGLRVIHAAFFSRDAGLRVAEAPGNHLLAMGFTAVACLAVSLFPGTLLFPRLPHPEVTYHPFTPGHLLDEISLALFAALAFLVLVRTGIFPAPVRGTLLDADWLYRRGGPALYRLADRILNPLNLLARRLFVDRIARGASNFFESGAARLASHAMTPVWRLMGLDAARLASEREVLFRRVKAGAFPVGVTAFFAVILLGVLTLVYFTAAR